MSLKNHWIALNNPLVILKLRYCSIAWYKLVSIFNELITNRTWHSTESTKLFICLKLVIVPSTLRRWIWKRSFISTVRPTVQTYPSRKQSFSKNGLPPNYRKLKVRAVRFIVGENVLKNGAFRERWRQTQTQTQIGRWLHCKLQQPPQRVSKAKISLRFKNVTRLILLHFTCLYS